MKNIFTLERPTLEILGVSPYGKTETTYQIECFLASKNIYITSDEEIKEGDWFITDGLLWKANTNIHLINSKKDKKIILTTDPDLIKDGVQTIPDEFLEWFINNKTCEFVEITRPNKCKVIGCDLECILFKSCENIYNGYEIITPKEPIIDDGWLSPMQRFRLREDKPVTTEEPKITLELTQQEARGLLNCLMRTSANGKDLDVGETVEEKLWQFLKPLENK